MFAQLLVHMRSHHSEFPGFSLSYIVIVTVHPWCLDPSLCNFARFALALALNIRLVALLCASFAPIFTKKFAFLMILHPFHSLTHRRSSIDVFLSTISDHLQIRSTFVGARHVRLTTDLVALDRLRGRNRPSEK